MQKIRTSHYRGGGDFCGFDHILDRFFGFHTEKLRNCGVSVLASFCGLRIFPSLPFGFRFSANILAVFRIWLSMWSSVFPLRFSVFLWQFI